MNPWSRRLFIKNGALVLAGLGAVPAFLHNTVFASDPIIASQKRKTFICIFQRGAVDGLSMVVPFGDPSYYSARSEIAIATPARSAGAAGCLDLDGFFGLHPSLEAFLPIFKSGHLSVIEAVGSPNASRSHFDAQDFMESGIDGLSSIIKPRDGWLNRVLQTCPEDRAKRSEFRAVSMSSTVPQTLQGEEEALAIADLNKFGIQLPAGSTGYGLTEADFHSSQSTNASNPNPGESTGFEAMYDAASSDALQGVGHKSFEAISIIKQIGDPNKYRPTTGVVYPQSPFGKSLSQIAQLIKANVGVEVAFAEAGGWDTHVNQGGATGQLSNRLNDFARSISALYYDLGDRMQDVVILTMSEFGRAVQQNGNSGTDHGHGTCFFALGGNIKGGQILGKWPGLSPEQLFEQRDLSVTTDYRDVFAEIAYKHLGSQDLKKVFPDRPIDPKNFCGLL